MVTDLMNGPCRPTIIVYIDEIDKVVAGAGNANAGDSSGTSQDQMQQFLTEMEDRGYIGQLNFGPPGSGKSIFAKATATTFGIPLIRADFGAAKSSLVGSSESRIRDIFRTIYAMAGQEGAFFIATANRLHTLSPELQRRFDFAMMFFDLPDKDERIAIGEILTTKKYPSLKSKNDPALWANAEGWSGANIRDCCKKAYAFNISLEQAAKRVVSAIQRDGENIRRLREMADGKFLSASYDGTYDKDHVTEGVASVSRDRTFKIK